MILHLLVRSNHPALELSFYQRFSWVAIDVELIYEFDTAYPGLQNSCLPKPQEL